MPRQIERALYPLSMNSDAFATASDRHKSLGLDADIERFVDDYYAADGLLYEEAKRAARPAELTV